MISIVAVGKIKEKSLSQLIEEYKKRIGAYSKIEIIEVSDEPRQLCDFVILKGKTNG